MFKPASGGLFDTIPKSQSFDNRLVGFWTWNGQEVEIAADHWLYMSGAAEFTISSDGTKLNYPAHDPEWIYSRVAGHGTALEGIWKIEYISDARAMSEEVNFRGNGTYTWQTFIDGHFDSLFLGTYHVAGSSLVTRERRALVRTGPANQIEVAVSFGQTISGTYVVADDGSNWTLVESGGASTVIQRKVN